MRSQFEMTFPVYRERSGNHDAIFDADGRLIALLGTLRGSAELANLIVDTINEYGLNGDAMFNDEARGLSEIKDGIIEVALSNNRGNVSMTARKLGVGRSSIYRFIKRNGWHRQ